MRFLKLAICVVVLLGGLSGRAQDKKHREHMCAVSGEDLADQSAPRFEQYQVESSSPFPPAQLDPQSNPLAKRYRTVIREEMTHGPNFAGHYRVVFWGCGTSCSQLAVVNLKTGQVMTLKGIYSVAYADFNTNDFLPQTASEGYGFRFKKDSNLLVLVGTLILNHSKKGEFEDGAFYYVLRNEELQLVHSTLVTHRTCQEE
jgi:hypothetical protein